MTKKQDEGSIRIRRYKWSKVITDQVDIEAARDHRDRCRSLAAQMSALQEEYQKGIRDLVEAFSNKHGAPRGLQMVIDSQFLGNHGLVILHSMEQEGGEEEVIVEVEGRPN